MPKPKFRNHKRKNNNPIRKDFMSEKFESRSPEDEKVAEAADLIANAQIGNKTSPIVDIEPERVVFGDFAHFMATVENSLQLGIKVLRQKINIAGMWNVDLEWNENTYTINGEMHMRSKKPFEVGVTHEILDTLFIHFMRYLEINFGRDKFMGKNESK